MKDSTKSNLNNQHTKVIVGMSGGVDSSVAALLLLQAGYLVEGLFMKNWEEDDGKEYCTATQDLADAGAVCAVLGIPLHEANFAAEYWDNVFAHFLDEYQQGRTPNPDVLCNREIKFKVFADYARLLGAKMIATGHYARVRQISGETRLYKGVDADKDQSYFLQSVSQQQLAGVIFPLGELCKRQVREIAREHGLPTHSKKDSTGICFIGERRFRDFLKTYLPEHPGDIVTTDGCVIGQHQGLMYHTLGQRQGLGIGGLKGADETPWYVADKDPASNRLVVAQGNKHPALFCRAITLHDMHWIGQAPALPLVCMAKTRYRQPDQPCRLTQTDADDYTLTFDDAQRSVTPGQWACLYDGEVCLGGGVIQSTI